VHVFDPQLHALLRPVQGALQVARTFRLEFFNTFDSGARALVDDPAHSPFAGPESAQAACLVVVGLGQMGESLVLRAAASYRGPCPPAAPPLRITVVDRRATQRVKALLVRYPWLAPICKIEPLPPMDVSEAEFLSYQFLFDAAGQCLATHIYVCIDDDARSLAAALGLLRRLRDDPVQIIARMVEERGLAHLLRQPEVNQGGLARLYPFSLLERSCRWTMVVDGTCEVLARALHDAYVRHQRQLGHTPETNKSMVPWEQSPDDLKESNRQQADHIAVKLAAVGCGMELLTDWTAAVAFTFTSAEVEKLAEMEHDRWVAERLEKGYRLGPRDPVRKTIPYLVAWGQLTNEVQEYDREAVRRLPWALAGAGLQIYRLKPRPRSP